MIASRCGPCWHDECVDALSLGTRDRVPVGFLIPLSMGSFVVGDAALAGLKVLSVVDGMDRRLFALERVGRSGVRGSIGPHARERPHPRRRPGKDASVEGLP